MATAWGVQLQPFEENQSPSPEEVLVDPFDRLALRSNSPPHHPSPSLARGNSLHRQLSPDPESPPPAWKRRSTLSTPSKGPSPGQARPSRSPSESARSGPPSARRHPHLAMTATVRAALPPQLFLDESPDGSSTSINEQALPLPQPAFRRRTGTSSNRSSVISQDLSGMTSEDLWNLEQEGLLPDMSNPERHAAERPLDTVRRMSRRSDNSYHGLPGDVIWPSAPPVEEIHPGPFKSKSLTNVPGLQHKATRLGRKKTARQTSDGAQAAMASPIYQQAKTEPTSPVDLRRPDSIFISSAHSSSTDLSGGFAPTKPQLAPISRPPSAYYSRDFLSSLAPREGGYAIAAMMGGGLGAVGTTSIEERRKTTMFDEQRSRSTTRAPVAKSAGMGRWSLDGGENYGRPYISASPATTTSNLSHPPINSPDPSPPADAVSSEPSLTLPDGANLPQREISALPVNPSPLRSVEQPLTTPPILASSSSPLAEKKSKKALAKEAKAAEKAEAARIAREKAEAARVAAAKKQEQKEEAKRKEKEDKERKKADKKASKLKSASNIALPLVRKRSSVAGLVPEPAEVSPVPSVPTVAKQAAQSEYKVRPEEVEKRPTRVSLPLERVPQPDSASGSPEVQKRPRAVSKLSLFGTLKKRFSVVEPLPQHSASEQAPLSGSTTSVPPQQPAETPVSPAPEHRSVDRQGMHEVGVPFPAGEGHRTAERGRSPQQQTFATPPGTMSSVFSTPPSAQIATPHDPVPIAAQGTAIVEPVAATDLAPRWTRLQVSPPRSTDSPIPLGKTMSNQSRTSLSDQRDASSPARPRNSMGPRPMPTSRPRSTSATSAASRLSRPVPSPPAAHVGSSSFPFNPVVLEPPQLAHVHSNVTTSTSNGRTTSTTSDLASPFTSESSRKSSMTSAEQSPGYQVSVSVAGKDREMSTPIRESSKDTIKGPSRGAQVTAR